MAKRRRRSGWMWAAGSAFAAGYVVVALLGLTVHAWRGPVAGSAAAVGVVMFLARRAGSMLQGALWGLGLGLAGSLGIAAALVSANLGPSAGPPSSAASSASPGSPAAGATAPAAGPGPPATAPAGAIQAVRPQDLQVMILLSGLTTCIVCTAAGAIFAALGERRRQPR